MENKLFYELIDRYSQLNACKDEICELGKMLINTYESGGKLLLCGNGGSAADCNHIAGELLKSFRKKRPLCAENAEKFRKALGEKADRYINTLEEGLEVISLPSQSAPLTAFSNDKDPELIFAQLVYAYAKPNDMLLTLSTSGNSANAVCAAEVAKSLGLGTAALTGANDSSLSRICDVTVKVPEVETFKVQELHLPIYHYLCAYVEEYFFK